MIPVCFRRSLLDPHNVAILESALYYADGIYRLADISVYKINKDKNGQEFIELNGETIYLNRNHVRRAIPQSSTQFYILECEAFQQMHERSL